MRRILTLRFCQHSFLVSVGSSVERSRVMISATTFKGVESARTLPFPPPQLLMDLDVFKGTPLSVDQQDWC